MTTWPRVRLPFARGTGERPEHEDIGADHEQHAPQHRPLAQPGRFVLQRVQTGAAVDEAIDRPACQSEQPQLLARRRIHGEPVGVVGVALRAAHLIRVAVAPDRALAQQPMRRQPRAAEHDRRPPRVSGEHDGGREAADHLDQAARDEVHRDEQRRAGHAQVEISRDRKVVGELRILQVPHPRRADARFGQPVVKPGGRAVAEVGANCLMDRREHLEQHEDDADEGEPVGEAVAALHGRYEHAHGDSEDRGQHAAQHKDHPPYDREGAVRLRQHGEELPLVAGA